MTDEKLELAYQIQESINAIKTILRIIEEKNGLAIEQPSFYRRAEVHCPNWRFKLDKFIEEIKAESQQKLIELEKRFAEL